MSRLARPAAIQSRSWLAGTGPYSLPSPPIMVNMSGRKRGQAGRQRCRWGVGWRRAKAIIVLVLVLVIVLSRRQTLTNENDHEEPRTKTRTRTRNENDREERERSGETTVTQSVSGRFGRWAVRAEGRLAKAPTHGRPECRRFGHKQRDGQRGGVLFLSAVPKPNPSRHDHARHSFCSPICR